PESQLDKYKKYSEAVGLISFNPRCENAFSFHRDAKFNDGIDPKTLMTVLHTKEYKSIVKSYYGHLPEITSFNQFKICSDLINKIPKLELNALFIDEIKKRGAKGPMSSR